MCRYAGWLTQTSVFGVAGWCAGSLQPAARRDSSLEVAFLVTARTLLDVHTTVVARRQSSKSNFVTVVADNPQTIEVLHSYFTRAGITSNMTRKLHAVSLIPSAASAVVLFPDDFGAADVKARLLALRRARPKLLIVLVTGAPQQLSAALAPDGRSVPPLVLPKPAFGWTILDAIRGRTGVVP